MTKRLPTTKLDSGQELLFPSVEPTAPLKKPPGAGPVARLPEPKPRRKLKDDLREDPVNDDEPNAASARIDEFKQALEWLVGQPISLTLTRNRTRLAGLRHRAKEIDVRLDEGFLEANPEVICAVANWIKHPRLGPSDIVRKFAGAISRPLLPPRAVRRVLVTKGVVSDLQKIYERLNVRFFEGKVAARITYGRDTSRQKVRSRRLGSYSHRLNRITIHPLLDNPRVPDFVIAFTVFHEMLHALQPAGHKRPHDAAFRGAERAHPDYERVMRWRKKNGKLLNGGGKKG